MKQIMISAVLLATCWAMPPKFPTNAMHSCIIGEPRSSIKDLRDYTIETAAILVQFTDNRADTIEHTPARYDSMFYSTGVYYGQYRMGSLNDFFLENSYGDTDVSGGIAANRWHMSNNTYSYYDDNNYMLTTGYQLACDAVILVDGLVNFHDYDLNNDGHIDGVFVIHAGPGGEDTGNQHHCWSHAIPSFNYTTNDGVIIDGATNVPEINLVTPSLDTTLCCIGVMCHELGHIVGLPDLYDPTRNTWGIGYWSLMSYGAWGAGGNTPWSPSHADAWCKKEVNWLSLTPITANTFGLRILDLETYATAYRVWRNGVVNDTFFILENRQNIGFDTPLPGTGLLIWHFDPRYSAYHNKLDLEEADGCDDLENGWGYRPDPHYYHHELGDAGDPYPGDSGNVLFDSLSYPSSNSNYGQRTGVIVRNIHVSGDTVICDVLINSIGISESHEEIAGLLKAAPNPFSDKILFTTSTKYNKACIYDVTGRKVKELNSGSGSKAGCFEWNATDEHKNHVASGIYFFIIRSNEDLITCPIEFFH